MTEKKHSVLGASSMERWAACPGSVKLCEGYPNTSSAAAQEGTTAHDYAEKFVRGDLPAEEFQRLPDEMQAALKMYADAIFDEMKPNCKILIEHEFDLSSVFPGCFGTCDAVVWNPAIRTLHVFDFKYGRGHFVEVEENLQLLYYALGALVTLGFPALQIEITIVQPRCEKKKSEKKVRTWRVDAFKMLDFEAYLVERATATLDPNAPLVPGRYCYFCPAHTGCPAKSAERLAKAIESFDVVSDEDDPFS